MKFTKEQFLETLKTKNGAEKLLSNKTVQGMEALYGFAGEEEEMDAFVERISPLIKTFEGQVRKMNSDHFKEKQEWEKQNPKPKPDEKPAEPTDKIDLLLQEIGELKKEREAEKAAKELTEYKTDVSKQLGEKLKDFDNAQGWIERRLKGYAFDPKADKEELVKSLVADYNADFAGVKPNTTPRGAGGGSEGQDPELAKIRKMREEQIKREKEKF